MKDFEAITFLPSSPNAPKNFRVMAEEQQIDFDENKIDTNKLAAFERLVEELCTDFTVYEGMFGSKESRLESCKLGLSVMLVVERSLITQICLRFSALVGDKSPRRKSDGSINKDKEVVSFMELIEPLNSLKLCQKCKEFRDFYASSGLKKWRNKVIAHNDLKIFNRREKVIPKLTTDIIAQQLDSLNESLCILKGEPDKERDTYTTFPHGEGLDRYKEVLAKINS